MAGILNWLESPYVYHSAKLYLVIISMEFIQTMAVSMLIFFEVP